MNKKLAMIISLIVIMAAVLTAVVIINNKKPDTSQTEVPKTEVSKETEASTVKQSEVHTEAQTESSEVSTPETVIADTLQNEVSPEQSTIIEDDGDLIITIPEGQDAGGL